MSAYLYLLWHKSEARFKLGTIDLLAASPVDLYSSQGDSARSKAVCLPDYATATNAEQVLSRMFQRYRIVPGEEAMRKYPALLDGDTEWFSAECSGRMLSFIEDNEDLLDCKWVSPPEVQALFAPASTRATERLKAFAQGTLELEQQNGVYDTVSRAGHALEAITRACRFVAVVQTEVGYQMVGEAPAKQASFLKEGFERLYPLLKPGQLAADTAEGHYFAIPMRGAPGQAAEDAADYESWRERLVWAVKPQLPGFDVPLRTTDAQQATRILRDMLGLPVSMGDTFSLAV